MTKNKYPLRLFSIISLAIIVLSVIFVSIFGVRTSIEIGGGHQLDVTLSYTSQSGEFLDGRQNTADYVSQIKKVLSKHNASIDSYFVEDKNVDTILVVRVASNKIKDSKTISADIANALKIDQSKVSFVSLGSYFSTTLMLYIGLSVACLLIVAFFFGWIRYGVLSGVALMFATLHNLIISMALIFLTRVQFSAISLASVLVATVFTLIATCHILEREKENSKSKQYSTLNYNEKLILATKQSKLLLVLPILCAVISLVMMCTPIKYLQLGGVSILLSVLSTLYTTLLITPALYANIMELKLIRQKQKLSKNVVTKTKK